MVPIILSFLLISAPAGAVPPECRNAGDALRQLQAPAADPELRSRSGFCLLRHHTERAELHRSVLRILRDPEEDILLKEDLLSAFAESPLRKKLRIEGIAPKLGRQDAQALERTISGAGSLLAAAQAVKSMEEIVPAVPQEAEYFRVISQIALDDGSHVLLRSAAILALEKASVRIVDSGVYDEKLLRLVRETLQDIAARGDSASEFVQAGPVAQRLAIAGLPGFQRGAGDAATPKRVISSLSKEK